MVYTFPDYYNKKTNSIDLSDTTYTVFHFPTVEGGPFGINKIILPKILKEITPYSFDSIDVKIIVAEGIERIYADSFKNSSVEIIDLSKCKDLETIGRDAFKNSYIKAIKFPSSVKRLNAGAFENCKQLKEITIPDSVKYVSSGVFSGCKTLESIKLPKNLEILESYVFKNCKSLKTLVIPDNVDEISSYALLGTNLEKLYLPKNLAFLSAAGFPKNIGEIHYSGNNKSVLKVLESYCKSNHINLMIENYDYILENIENFSFKDLNNAYKKENELSL